MIFLLFLLACRLLARRKFSFSSLAQDGFIAWQFFCLPLIVMGQLYVLADLFLCRYLKTPLQLDHFYCLKQTEAFWGSAQSFGIWKWIGTAAAIVVGTIMIDPIPIPWPFGMSCGILAVLFSKDALDNPLFRLQWTLFLPKSKAPPPKKELPSFLTPPAEESFYLSPAFPLLKYTTAFKGPKLFELSNLEKPHLVFLFLESFRAKDINPRTTPFFHSLKDQGIYFSQFYSNGVLTHQAVIASLFGIYPFFGSMREHAMYGEPKQKTDFKTLEMISLASILKREGYQTAYIDAALSLEEEKAFFQKHAFDFVQGRHDFSGAKHTSWGIYDEDLMRYLASFLEKAGNHPHFTVGFTVSNHHPWQTPSDYNLDPFEDIQDPIYQKFLKTMRYSDSCLELLFQELKTKQLLDRTIFFIMGDHGQGMGEHGLDKLQNSVYEENIHIPLLILAPHLAPQVIQTPSSQVDLIPTVLDLLGAKTIHHAMGRSLMRKGEMPLFFNNSNIGFSLGMREGDHKYVMTSLMETTEEYFNLSLDPEEKHSLKEGPLDKQKARDCHDWMFSLYGHHNISFNSHTVIDFSDTPSVTDLELLRKLRTHAPPSVLNLKGCLSITDQGLKAIAPYCKHLKSLNLSNCLITDKGVKAIEKKAKHLTHIDLSDCPLIDSPYAKKANE